MCFIIMAAVIAIDQITKWLAVQYLTKVETVPIIKDILHLTYLENEGAAFGMLKNNRWVFLVISTVAIIGLIIYLVKYPPKNKWLIFGLSFIVGGGIGNMIDRLLLGYVVDFIDFRVINFAIFNGADSFVCIGAVLVLIYVFFFSEEKKEVKNDADS
ncbi:MAG: signal peptidase II [Clostridia bacterium]|nr:signal peptidase II [Clostridia bacterium]MBR6602493.1 signal peptidase II [Clostridia bacterium]